MSSAPGGFLPPLDPNPQSGSSTRLVLTASLMLMVWMGITIFGPQPPPPANKTTDAPAVAAPSSSPTESQGAPPALAGTSDQLPEQTVAVAADVEGKAASSKVKGGFEGTLSSWGAQITRWSLTGYFETKLDAKHQDAAHTKVDIAKGENQGAHLLGLRSRGGDVALKTDAPWELVEQSSNKAVFSRLTASGVRLTRSYVVDDAHFSVRLETTLKNEGAEKRTAELDMVLVGRERKGERDEGGMFVVATDKLGGACVTSEERHTFVAKKAEDDPEDHVWKETIRSAAIDRHYFVGAVTFDAVPTEGCKATTWKKSDDDRGLDVVVSLSPIPLAPGEVKSFSQEAYLGPKQIDALQDFGHGMQDAIDFGMLAVLSRPLLWLLVQIESQTHDYGLAIIGLTLCIFLITLPLTHRSMVEMKKFGKVMKDLKPDLDKLKEKYGHDQRLMVEKQQAFFQEKGVNPFANLMGCLPMLISMPVWIALYRTLSTAVELYQQPFHYLPNVLDLTQADAILFGWPLLPFIVCGLMLVSTLQQPPPEDQPQMKYVMYGMPVFFLFIMFNMASGLSIYMITNSLLRMAQSHYIKIKHG